MADYFTQRRFEQPWPQPQFGGGGGGRGAPPPAWDKPPSGYSPWASRPFYEPEMVPMYNSVRILGRLAKMAALSLSAGAAFSPVLDFSQASWPGFHNDIGYEPKGLGDIRINENAFEGEFVPGTSEEFARVSRIPLLGGTELDELPSSDVVDATGSHVISQGGEVKNPTPVSVPIQPVWNNQDLARAQKRYDERIAAANAAHADWESRNDKWVQRELGAEEGRRLAEEKAAAQRELDAEVARWTQERAQQVPEDTPQVVVQPIRAADSAGVRFQFREAERPGVRRRRDSKVDQRTPAIWRIAEHMMQFTGSYTEMVDMFEALAWNVYVYDARGRVVPAMSKYNHSLHMVFREWALGRGRVDVWGFVVDYAINQWSDAAYAFQAKRIDQLAFSVGWQAPRGLNASLENAYQQAGGYKHDFLSQAWIRSQSRLFRSLDVSRSRRVQSLFQRRRLPFSLQQPASSFGVWSST